MYKSHYLCIFLHKCFTHSEVASWNDGKQPEFIHIRSHSLAHRIPWFIPRTPHWSNVLCPMHVTHFPECPSPSTLKTLSLHHSFSFLAYPSPFTSKTEIFSVSLSLLIHSIPTSFQHSLVTFLFHTTLTTKTLLCCHSLRIQLPSHHVLFSFSTHLPTTVLSYSGPKSHTHTTLLWLLLFQTSCLCPKILQNATWTSVPPSTLWFISAHQFHRLPYPLPNT